MTTGLEIRRYRPEDHDAVVNLHVTALTEVGALAERGPWDADLDDIEAAYLRSGGEFVVGLAGADLVAMGAIRPRAPGVAELKRMRVEPGHQRRGYGRAILVHLLDRAAALGYREVVLDTTVQQRAAIAMYRAHGFAETGRTVIAGFDCILFRRSIADPAG